MTVKDFPAFYEAVRGYPPFEWQRQLAEDVYRDGIWPDVVDLPTASGKTSVVDVAVFLQALGKGPRRLFYVIDRRIVVDSVGEHAQQLAGALESASEGVLRDVAERLSRFTSKALAVVTLRGGMYRDDSWVYHPAQPLVVVSTVDQVGSRLLFRGYGISEGQRPIHAGLAGNDVLIVIDEAHISRPFVDTACQIAGRRTEGSTFCVVEMTATPHSEATKTFSPKLDDALLTKRHRAPKNARLLDSSNFEPDVTQCAKEVSSESNVVGVVVNTVSSARAVFEELRRSADAVLLTGRIRPYDRDRLLENYLPRMRAGRDRSQDQRLFVVATQTVEVGADLDFDALVTEAAALDALLQRFGRLDRLGELGETRAFIVRRKGVKDAPVYGKALDTTWKWLRQRASRKVVDFSIQAMRGAVVTEDLRTPTTDAPLITSAHLTSWVQTRPTPEPDPPVAPFLHGDEQQIDVQLVWRADLGESDPESWLEVVALASPNVREALPVPVGEARRWLDDRPALDWKGPESALATGIRPGQTLVVPSSYGGCDEFGWNPSSTAPVPDIGDLCARSPRKRLHLDKSLREDLEQLWESDGDPAIKEQIRQKLGEELKGEWLIAAPNLCLVQMPVSAPTTEDDSASFSRRAVGLEEHSKGVAEVAHEFASACGLSSELCDDLRLAGRLHDQGKADPRFQLMLGAGKEPLAKSASLNPLADYLRVCRELNVERLPRHEVLSLCASGVEAANDRELVRHLIGTHHGYGRGFFPAHATDGQLSEAEWTDQFMRLRRRYGDWGLAFVEAVLRTADWMQSRKEQER